MAGLAAPMGFGGSWAGFVGPGGGPGHLNYSDGAGAWAFSGEEFDGGSGCGR